MSKKKKQDLQPETEEQVPTVDEWGDPIDVPESAEPQPTADESEPLAPPSEAPKKRSKSGKVRMTDKEKIALERQLVKEGKIYPRGHYLPRGRFRSILALLLAFLFGVFLMLGAIVGAGVYVASRPLKDVLGIFQSEKFKPDDYVGADYLDMTIADLAKDIMATFEKGDEMTINDIRKYSPYIDEILNGVWNNIKESLGVEVDTDKLYSTAMKDMLTYLRDDFAMGLELGMLLKLNSNSDAMLLALCYGEEGTDYHFDEEGNIVLEKNSTHKPVTVGDLVGNEESEGITALMNTVQLGLILKLNIVEDGVIPADNAMMYALCYGKLGTDYEIVNGRIKMLEGHKATTIGDLITNSNELINGLELGAMLGIDSESGYAGNELMYSLCYGTKDEAWTFVDGKVRMNEGYEAITIGNLVNESGEIIHGMEVAALLGVNAKSDKMMRYLAFGTELEKDKDGNYRELKAYDENAGTGKAPHYVYDEGDGRYMIVDGEIVMLPDPNAADYDHDAQTGSVLFAKRKVSDLLAEDSDLIEGMTIGDIIDFDNLESEIGLLTAIKDWTIADLQNQDKINSIKIGDILETTDESSALLLTLAALTLGDLQDENTITSFKLGDIINLEGEDTSAILTAMKGWKLSDLQDQSRIERLSLKQILDIDPNDPNTSRIMLAMADWRISDLTDQSRIDSLKLSDVLTIGDDSAAVLKAIADKPIGKLSDSINNLTLNQLLGDVSDNKILSHLGDSTVSTLANDLKHLSIGTVFAEEVYSYIDIKDGMTYQAIYDDYALNHANSEYENFSMNALDIKEAEVTPYRTLPGQTEELTEGFYTANGKLYEGGLQKRDMAIVSANYDKDASEQESPWFYEEEIALTAHYAYEFVEFTKTDKDALAAIKGGTFTEPDAKGDVYYVKGDARYLLKEDGYGFYFEVPTTDKNGKADTERWEIDRVVSSYTAGNTKYTSVDGNWTDAEGNVIEVLEKDGAYYYLNTVKLYKLYSDGNKTYTEAETIERYKRTSDDAPLDRYMQGVWFLLFGYTEDDGTIGFNADTPILEMDSLISGVGETISYTPLWKLFFHKVFDSNPFVVLELNDRLYPNGVNIERNGETIRITNLNDVAISELKQIIEQLTKPDMSWIPSIG